MAFFQPTKAQVAQWSATIVQGTVNLTALDWLLRIAPFNDVITGSSGNETFNAASEGTLIFAFDGNDRLNSTFNRTALIAGGGNDTLVTDVLVPMSGNNDVEGLAVQFGGAGKDNMSATVMLQGGVTTVQDRELRAEVLADGGAGNDMINAVANVAQPVFGNVKAITHLLGGSGDDTINAVASTRNALDDNYAKNEIDGGAGNDHITALAETEFKGFTATAINILDGGAGNDVIKATARGVSNGTELVSNSLHGGTGDDVLHAFNFTDSNSRSPVGINTLWGDEGNDTLEATHTTDGENTVTDVTNRLNGGTGDDRLKADSTALGGFVAALNALSGGAGKDALTARIVADAHGGPGSLGLSLYHVANLLSGGTGNDTLDAFLSITSAPFAADGSRAENRLDGGVGNDVLVATVAPGSFGSSFLTGGVGNDQLTVFGGSSNVLNGGNGNDKLTGGIGSDDCIGGAGNDIIKGLAGNDTLTGGVGSDTFVFNTALDATNNVDVISDYNVTNDTIQIENAIFTALTTPGVLSLAAFAANETGLAGDASDRIVYETDTGNLYYDRDGNGASYGGVHFATLTAGLALTANDFVVI